MHLRHLLVQHCKLMRRLEVPFLRADGSPRLWTVFVGENGTCKTTLLRAIALSTAGSAFANHLVDDPASYLDRRDRTAGAEIFAKLGFSPRSHAMRSYPGIDVKPRVPPGLISSGVVEHTSVVINSRYAPPGAGPRNDPASPPPSELEQLKADLDKLVQALESVSAAPSQNRAGESISREFLQALARDARFRIDALGDDPLSEARSSDLPQWFVAAYGVGRVLSSPQVLSR
jgi:hypothetical protein